MHVVVFVSLDGVPYLLEDIVGFNPESAHLLATSTAANSSPTNSSPKHSPHRQHYQQQDGSEVRAAASAT